MLPNCFFIYHQTPQLRVQRKLTKSNSGMEKRCISLSFLCPFRTFHSRMDSTQEFQKLHHFHKMDLRLSHSFLKTYVRMGCPAAHENFRKSHTLRHLKRHSQKNTILIEWLLTMEIKDNLCERQASLT